ncbi:MAG: NUDIX hydrolase [Alphaproteobacteria bacterium]|nr:NUDIX hydrolase [Alphaproteobacteria bacterium]
MVPSATRKNGYPVSVKGVVLFGQRVLLLRNDRDDWELPGGRPDIAETWPQALVRELQEEANLGVVVGPLIDEWPYEVLPGRFVWIAAYGCRPISADALRISAEHRDLKLFDLAVLDSLRLYDGYRASIDRWAAAGRDGLLPSGSSR